MIGVKKGLFGKRQPWMTPGIGDGLPNTMPEPYSMPQDATMRENASFSGMADEPRKGLDWKGALMGALGGAADAAAVHFGGQPLIAQGQQMKLMQAAALAAEQRKRAADLADYRSQMQIKSEFERPEAPKPGSFEWFQTATPEQRAQYGDYREVGQDDEFVIVPIPGRGTYAGPRSGLPSVFGQAQPSTVPQSEWDSAKPLGGTSGNAGGGFRP